MSTIGKLNVLISANATKLVTELSKTKKMLKSWASNVGSIVGGITKYFTLAAGAIATVMTGLAALIVVKNTEAIKSIDIMARSFGVSATAMQEWGVAGKAVNLSAEKIGDIFKDTTEKIGEFIATGSGGAKDVFEQLNLNAQEFVNIAPDQAILKISEAMEGMANQDKIFLFESLASDSSLLIPLLNDGAAGFKAMAEEARNAGIILSDAQVNGVVAFSNSLQSLGLMLNGFGKTLTAILAPAFDLVVKKVNQTIKEMGGMKAAAQKFAGFIVSAMDVTIKAIGGAITAVQELILTLKKAQLMYMLMDNLAGKLVPFGEDYSPAQLQKVADDILKMEQRIADGNGIQKSVVTFMESLRDTVEQQKSLLPNDLKLSNGERDYDGIVSAIEGAKKAGDAQQSLAASATLAARTLDEVSKSSVWKDIFGKKDITARSNQFDTYAKLAKSNIESGSSFTQSNINTLKSILDTAKNNGGTGFSNNGLFEKLDLNGMEQVIKGLEAMMTISGKDGGGSAQTVNTSIDKLIQANTVSQNVVDKLIQSQQGQETLGKLSIDMTTDTGKVAGEIFGKPKFLSDLKTWADNYTNNNARQAAQ